MRSALLHLHPSAAALRVQRSCRLRCFASTSDQPHGPLSDQRSIPLLGLGTWKHTPEQAAQAVECALDTGYKHIDCATAYSNHEAIGEVFKSKFSGGGVKREDVWITSKLFNSDHASPSVPKACKKALSELKLDYLDLYLVHWPAVAGCTGDTLTPSLLETWMAMERLADEGLCKTIGISNFSVAKTKELIQTSRHPPVVNQVEAHPYWRQDKLYHYCKSMNVHMTAYSPLGTPDSAEMMKRKDEPKILEDSTVASIAKELGKTPAQVLLRWGIQRGTSVIPKATSPERIRENFGALSFELSAQQMEQLSTLEYQARYVSGTFILNPEGPYRTLDQLWDGEVSDINRKQAQAAGF